MNKKLTKVEKWAEFYDYLLDKLIEKYEFLLLMFASLREKNRTDKTSNYRNKIFLAYNRNTIMLKNGLNSVSI